MLLCNSKILSSMKSPRFFFLAGTLFVSGISVLPAYAADDVVNNSSGSSKSLSTREALVKLKNSKPFPRQTGNQKPKFESSVKGASGFSRSSDGGRGRSRSASNSGSRAYGSFGIPYTSTRVRVGNVSGTSSSKRGYLSASYPYRPAGLLISSGGACSAQLIGPSILITAAHCVGPFGGERFFSNFTFYPGVYEDRSETNIPYGTWNSVNEVLPGSWYRGTDSGSGACRNNDLAILVLDKNSKGEFLGDKIGWYSYSWANYSFLNSSKTKRSTAAVTTLGYPGLLDNGKIMQRQDGPAYLATCSGGGKQIYQGSNFTAGSSGGAWLVNFGSIGKGLPSLSGGASKGSEASQAVVGVTSWGASDPNARKDNWSSRFGRNKEYTKKSYKTTHSKMVGQGNIGSLLNSICKVGGKNSYYNLGYCK